MLISSSPILLVIIFETMDVDSGTVKLVSVSLCSSQEGGGDDGVGTLGARVGEIVFF